MDNSMLRDILSVSLVVTDFAIHLHSDCVQLYYWTLYDGDCLGLLK